MRKRFPWWLVLVAFVVVPLIEIYVIIQVGRVVGAWWTIVLLIADSALGSWLVKREGRRAWEALRQALRERRLPHRELADAVLILVGGLLMVTPGFVLDVVGAICILPFTRPLGRRLLAAFIGRRLGSAAYLGTPAAGATAGTWRRPGREPEGPGGRGGVVRGEVVDDPQG